MMKQTLFLAVLAVVLGLPGRLAGQRPPRAMPFSMGGPPPAPGRLGVLVNAAADAKTDSIGARLEAVTPGGPAAKAGLKAGDIITRFNGTSLAAMPPADEDPVSGPGRKLGMLARALEPGDTVPIEYRRGSDKKKAKLVAEDLGGLMGMDRVDVPQPGGISILEGGGGPEQGFSFCFGEAWCAIELVSLNSDLGEYFGAKEGILVVNAPADSSVPLKSGDVVLSIGTRRPVSPSHAMRILRSYDPGETVAIDIMRKQKHVSVTWHVPQSEEHMRQFMRLHRMVSDSGPAPPEN
jgi:S1-C subfamily serine protease